MVWKIAAGVFLGLFLYAVFACSALGIIGGASVAAANKTIAESAARSKLTMERQAQIARARDQQARIEDVRHQRAAMEERQRRKEQGLRCINGQEFQRVENGWVQTANSCAR